jgi:hypothetical protein
MAEERTPKELIQIAFAKEALPESAIAQYSADDLFKKRPDLGGASIFLHSIVNCPDNARLMLKKQDVTAEHIFTEDAKGNNGLHYAADRKNKELVLDILNHSGVTATHISKANNRGNTPLTICERDQEEMRSIADTIKSRLHINEPHAQGAEPKPDLGKDNQNTR